MIKALLALIALLAAPISGHAFSQMQTHDCDAAWQAATGEQLRHSLSKEGWCQAQSPAGFSFDQFEWRAEGLEQLLQNTLPPTAVAIRVTDADMLNKLGVDTKPNAPAMPMQITLVLRQNAQAKHVVIEPLKIAGPNDNMVTLQGTFHDVDLSSTAKMQLSLGSAKLRDVTILGFGNRKLAPFLQPYIGDTFPERSRKRSAMIDQVSDWPTQSFPTATKRAIKQMIATLPAPNGTLHVEVDTGAGLSAAIFIQTFVIGGSSEGVGDRILSGTVLHATWANAE